MATTMTAIISDLKSVSDTLSSFHKQSAEYLLNPATAPHPDTWTLLTSLNVDNLLTHLHEHNRSSNGIEQGVLGDVTNQVFAIQREISLRGMIKADFYNHSAGDKVQEMEGAMAQEGSTINTVRGKLNVI